MSRHPDRRRAPTLNATPQLRKMALIGLTEDGRMVLWSEGNVLPVSKFETEFIDGRPRRGEDDPKRSEATYCEDSPVLRRDLIPRYLI